MLFQIELLYFVVMIAVFVVLLLVAKVPASISMMISALVGLILSGIISKTDMNIRHLIEGGFGYFDTILIITSAMIFMGGLQACGALDYFSILLVKAFHKVPTILLLSFMLIIMFPGMVTGSSLSSVVCSGALLAPIMIKIGIPKKNVGAIIAFGAILGMVCPPINVPVMVICDVVDIPYSGFTLPLIILTIPLAIFAVLFLGRKHVKKIELEELGLDFNILSELNWTVSIPLITLVVLIILENVFPKVFGLLGMTLIFIIATIPCFFVGKKANPIKVFKEGVQKSFSAMSLLIGVGMFVQVFTLCGARAYFVVNVLSLSDVGQYIAMALSLPIFGGISAFGSASILGGPFVMAFLKYNNIIVASGLSLLAGLGEFLPPTAMSATFASQVVEESGYIKITKTALIPFFVSLVYSVLFIIILGSIWG